MTATVTCLYGSNSNVLCNGLKKWTHMLVTNLPDFHLLLPKTVFHKVFDNSIFKATGQLVVITV